MAHFSAFERLATSGERSQVQSDRSRRSGGGHAAPWLRNIATTLALCGATVLALAAVARADEGEKVFQEVCSACHDAKTRPLDGVRLSRQQWKETIERMEGLGADIPGGEKRKALLDYLERTHGPAGAAPAEKR